MYSVKIVRIRRRGRISRHKWIIKITVNRDRACYLGDKGYMRMQINTEVVNREFVVNIEISMGK